MKCLALLICLVLDLTAAEKSQMPCVTPNGEKAHCVPLSSCDIFRAALNGVDETAKKFVEASLCPGNFHVCCGTQRNFTVSLPKEQDSLAEYQSANVTKETKREYVLKHFLRLSSYCGLQHSDDYLTQGNGTDLHDFPWMVDVAFKNYDRYSSGEENPCAGVLITNRIILTSIGCAGYSFTGITIGQYQKHNSTSCVTSASFGTECNDPVIEASGSRLAVDSKSSILLIRLKRPIQFSDYVRPICLPFEQWQRPKVGETVYTSGWDAGSASGTTTHNIKKKIAHQVTGFEKQGDDRIIFSNNGSSSNICEGDEGGPVMHRRRNQWYLAGILPWSSCKTKGENTAAYSLTPKTMEKLIQAIYEFLLPINNPSLE